MAEFDDLDAAIRKYYMENSELPICELDVEVPIDEKEIKPLSADFEEWQASENFDQSWYQHFFITSIYWLRKNELAY